MGAEYCEKIFKVDTKDALHNAFRDYHRELCYDNGHSGYTGTMAECPGLQILDITFNNPGDARDYVEQKAQKWDPAIAVRYKNKDGKIYYYVGAWCSS